MRHGETRRHARHHRLGRIWVRARIRVRVRLPPSTLVVVASLQGHGPGARGRVGHAGSLPLGRLVWRAEQLATHHLARARIRVRG